MALSEFEIIQSNFAARGAARADVMVGIGDDGAVVRCPSDCDLVTVMDTLVAGIHFPPDARPEDIGYKALAVNLSDVAAMGAVPAWTTLALTLPRSDADWLSAFARGFFDLAGQYDVQLIGGDTTRGSLTVTVQVQAFVPAGQAVLRAPARPGDTIYVTGVVGDAGLALRAWQRGVAMPVPYGDYLLSRLHRPVPRCKEGMALRGTASAMIDVSDGLAADLGHILDASGVGATLNVEAIPLSPSFIAVADSEVCFLDAVERRCLALSAGDDYELCFTVPAGRCQRVEELFSRFTCGCHAIGVIEAAPGLRFKQADGSALTLPSGGYDHFSFDSGE